MLIEFRFSNFRSFRDDSIFSMVASSDRTLAGTNVVDADAGSGAVPDLLRSAVIYGANGSGKSNLVSAMQFFQNLVLTSANQTFEGNEIQVAGFRMERDFATVPSEFEVTFVMDKVRYQYGCRLNRRAILEEWLLVYKNARAQQWFRRTLSNENVTTYKFSSSLSGAKTVWQEATRNNALFLSTAVLLNSESLRPIFAWITSSLHIGLTMQIPLGDLSPKMTKDTKQKQALLRLLNAADLSIADVTVEQRTGTQIFIEGPSIEGDPPSSRIAPIEMDIPKFIHRVGSYEVAFDPQDESAGTQKFFGLAGPILDVLRRGAVLVMDELDASLHVLLLKFIISLFHSAESNPLGAQLIFTTHNVLLLDRDLFRRDQFWLIERDASLRSHIFPLSDFAPRKDESLSRGYLSGRYGAIPILSKIGN